LFDAFKQHFGRDHDPILVWRAATRTMNPTVSQAIIDKAIERDASFASAEYLAQFRTDVESYVSRAVLEAVTIVGRFELPRIEGVAHVGFVDPSGGSSDSMTLGVCHSRGNVVVLDCLRERRPPFSPDAVVEEFSAVLRSYGVTEVHGDRYAGEWPREAFRRAGVEYRVAAKVKSDLYLNLLPLLNSGRVELLDHPRLIAQLAGLERRVSRAGKDSIDHVPGSHDDLANVLAGCAVYALAGQGDEFVVPPPGNCIMGEPRNVPNSVFTNDAYPSMHAGSPMKPSRNEPWWPYYNPGVY
jgi:hypothetical protein